MPRQVSLRLREPKGPGDSVADFILLPILLVGSTGCCCTLALVAGAGTGVGYLLVKRSRSAGDVAGQVQSQVSLGPKSTAPRENIPLREEDMIDYEHWKLLEEMKGEGTHWQIMGYPKFVDFQPTGVDVSRILAAGLPLEEAMIKAVTPLGIKPIHPIYPKKHVRVVLDNASALLEPGAMHFSKGHIEMAVEGVGSAGVGGFLKKAASGLAAGESMVKPRYTGTGELFLEPRTDFLNFIRLNEETLICDRGLFVACDGTLKVDGLVNRAALKGGEGLVQPRVQGSGVVMLSSPVPREQILVVNLKDETLKVDGPFVMAYWGDVKFTVEKSAKGMFSSAASGEGFVNVYKGSGTIWLNLAEAKCF